MPKVGKKHFAYTKAGYEWFQSQLVGGNSQSSTDYVFNVDFATDASGAPLKDAQGRIIPHFVPDESYIEFYPAVRGATPSAHRPRGERAPARPDARR